jgi:hypothetical protein
MSETVIQKHSAPRWIENLHILLWLFKDMCWAMVWRPGGVVMIVPTFSVAIYLLIRSRHRRTELYHNAAVVMWISANSTWMIGEFFNRDLRPAAVILFGTGIGILLYYYIFYFRKDRREERDLQNKTTS